MGFRRLLGVCLVAKLAVGYSLRFGPGFGLYYGRLLSLCLVPYFVRYLVP
jgi:hypothetical protein